MEYRTLGRSGIKVPELCFGCGTFGGHGNEFFEAWGASDVEEAINTTRYKIYKANLNRARYQAMKEA